jgi:glycosyltransferase involved in cell wall biosynthesis
MTTPISTSPYPPISPVVDGAARPFWSVMIPTYEPNPDFLRQVLDSVLAQDPGPQEMEIVLVDDASRRVDPRDCIPAGARERISWFRHEQNVGIGGNWNACVQRARGHWVHILHQDDLLRPGFYTRLRAGIESCPSVGAAFCRDVIVDRGGTQIAAQGRLREQAGIFENWIDHIFVGLHLRCVALVVKREVYETLGGFRMDLKYALDWDMWKRIAATHPLWYEPEPLACYRSHGASASIGFQRVGGNMLEIARSIELSESLLPPTTAAQVTRRSRENYTRYAVNLAWQAFAARNLRTGVAQLRAARAVGTPRAIATELARRARRAWG